ncbi:Mitogen-activated protein kinase 8 [Trifolium repens]|nr:Mitogen-activated protein kinase 8 [Trifolium repens]
MKGKQLKRVQNRQSRSSFMWWTTRMLNFMPSIIVQYTTAIDIWSIECIFAEVLTGKPLFPGESIVYQLDLITDFLGTPPPEIISGVPKEKAKKHLMEMQKKLPLPFERKFSPNFLYPSAIDQFRKHFAYLGY